MNARQVQAFDRGAGSLALKSARRWVRVEKAAGRVRVLGGGWWRVFTFSGRPFNVQGFGALALELRRRGILAADGSWPANPGRVRVVVQPAPVRAWDSNLAMAAAIEAERPAARQSFDLERVDPARIRRLLERAERFELHQTAAGARWLLDEIGRAKARQAARAARRAGSGVRS